MPRQKSRPTYCLHRPSRTAYTRIDGKVISLGKFDSPESRQRFTELLEEWSTRTVTAPSALTVDELAIRYLDHVDLHYRKRDGAATTEQHCVRLALRPLIKLHGRTRVREFGPLKLADVRKAMIEAGLVRTSINQNVGRIRRMFKWGVSQELVPPTVLAALESLAGLRAGRSKAKESEPVRPVAWSLVEAVAPFVSRQVWGAIRLQWLSGMRSSEVLSMRACDVNMSGNVWEYQPVEHKTSYRGKERPVYLGPEAQSVVREFLSTDLQAYLFSPKEARAEFVAANYRDGATVKAKGKGKLGDQYTAITYAVAIRRACVKADVPHWHPHQLRHAAATRIRREAGIETARVVLGHSSVAMTELYAEADRARAAEIMGRIG